MPTPHVTAQTPHRLALHGLNFSVEHFDILYGKACGGVSCITASTPWLPEPVHIGALRPHRIVPDPPPESYLDVMRAAPPPPPHPEGAAAAEGAGSSRHHHAHHANVLTYEHVALGLMAPAVPRTALGLGALARRPRAWDEQASRT